MSHLSPPSSSSHADVATEGQVPGEGTHPQRLTLSSTSIVVLSGVFHSPPPCLSLTTTFEIKNYFLLDDS